MKKDDSVYLVHITEAIESIEEYIKGIKQSDFLSKKIIQSAVIREIEIIGEASKMLSNKLRESHDEIPWKKIIGMRDKLIHGYFGVDLNAVWKTVKEDLPLLKKAIKKIST
ncbi:MAG: DUF86 domain-containing protein [Nanoarchaeota archaeon]